MIRNDIVQFRTAKNLDQVIVLWTANTERFSEIIMGTNDTADNLLKAIEDDHSEISPSTMFAVAAALEGVRHKLSDQFYNSTEKRLCVSIDCIFIYIYLY